MASLTNQKIKDTYEGLLKTSDNEAIDGAVEITDGAGNTTGVTLSNDGQVTATGTVSFGSLKDSGEDITVTKFVDEADGIGNNDNDTSIPTSAAVKDYVDTNVTAQDLDFQGDSGTGAVDLDSQVLDISGTANEIETSASGQTLTVGLVDSPTVSGTITGGTLTDGTATLTGGTLTGNVTGNVTGNITGNVTGDLTGDVTGDVTGDLTGNVAGNTTGTVTETSVLADGVTATTQSLNDNSTKVATTAYVDAQVTAEDLDFQGDSGTGAVDLDSQVLDIAGGTGIETSAVDQTLTIDIDSTVATLDGTQTLTNKSVDLTDNTLSGTTAEFNSALSDDDFATLAGTETLSNKTIDADNNTVSNLETDNLKAGVLDTDLSSVSAQDDTLASAKAIKTYVDDQITAEDLDFSGDTGAGSVDLDSETFSITGTNGITTTAANQGLVVDGLTLQTSISTNTTNISTNATNIASNDTDISTLQTDVSTNTTNISTNATNIASNDTDIATNATNISANTTNISTNATNIASNDSDISTLQTDVSTNTTNIATNATNISSNDTDIATNASNISTNTSNISTNATNIASNDTDISANASNISTNTSNISTNTGNISTNTSNISTNTSNISSNTTSISGKVAKAGDTMTGDLTIQTGSGIYLGGTATENKLDDYEEGTFTPTLTLSGSQQTISFKEGKYTKIGDTVFVQIRIRDSVSEDETNKVLNCTNLPFTVLNTSQFTYAVGTAIGSNSITNSTYAGRQYCYAGDNTTTLTFRNGNLSGIDFESDGQSEVSAFIWYKTS
jgi:predicted  nucleic acid-binding Zn-ribbon protein